MKRTLDRTGRLAILLPDRFLAGQSRIGLRIESGANCREHTLLEGNQTAPKDHPIEPTDCPTLSHKVPGVGFDPKI